MVYFITNNSLQLQAAVFYKHCILVSYFMRSRTYTSIGNIDNFINKHYMNCYTCMFYFLQLLSFFIIVYVLIFHNFHTKMGTGRWFENQTFYTDSGLQIFISIYWIVWTISHVHTFFLYIHIFGQVYSIQYYVIKLISDLRQVSDLLRVLWFPSPIILTTTI
jgi:hypothetical protein